MGYLERYHRRLFRWHQETFGPLEPMLLPEEKAYLDRCFALAESASPVAPSGYRHYSYYSYSHRVEGERVNSTRFAYGSLTRPEQAWEAARPVLEARGLVLHPFLREECTFYGLGWDLAQGHFKVYFLVPHLDRLPLPSLQALLAEGPEPRRREGLVSFTYAGGRLFEEKVYHYPARSEDLPAGARGRALMATSRRGLIPQYDVAQPEPWLERINPAGRRIVEQYAAIGETLDTIAFRDQDHFTLYFP